MNILDTIFRSYDIRGVYPGELNEAIADHIGKALGSLLKGKGLSEVVVGMDNRKSSPSLKMSFIEGLLSTGCSVTDVGLSLTPIIHFLTCVEDFDCGVEVTASHNPKDFNGFRIDYADARPFYGEDIRRLNEIISDETYVKGRGVLVKKDLFPLYLNYFKDHFLFSNNLNVVLDCGNGTSSFFAERIFSELGCNVIPLYCSSDNDYPHGTPDPESRIFLDDLQKKVLEHRADAGFAYDTDADRFGMVDEKGKAYDNDKLLMLFSKFMLAENPGATVVYDVKSSGVLDELIRSFGGIPKIMRTGHSYFVNAINEGAMLGGEFSGHTYFGGEYFGYDDGIYATCKVIEILEMAKTPLSRLMSGFPSVFHSSEIKIPCPDSEKFKLIEVLSKNFRELSDVKEVISIDGVRVKVTDRGWFLIRASNTSPNLSVRLEGATEAEAQMMLGKIKNVLSPFKFLDTVSLNSAEIYYS